MRRDAFAPSASMTVSDACFGSKNLTPMHPRVNLPRAGKPVEIEIEIVKRTDKDGGFKIIRRRWVRSNARSPGSAATAA